VVTLRLGGVWSTVVWLLAVPFGRVCVFKKKSIFGRLDIMYHRLPYISRGIFGRLDIMYNRLSYVSGGALPSKSLVLYIYQPRGTNNQSIIPPILFS
jgi:hypothetical protein